jgi:hypothetical protein
VFVDGDTRRLGDRGLDDLAHHVRDARAVRAGVSGREDWSAWWDAAGREPALADLVEPRAHQHSSATLLPLARQIELLRAAGFGSAGPVWQSGDDFVLVGIR